MIYWKKYGILTSLSLEILLLFRRRERFSSSSSLLVSVVDWKKLLKMKKFKFILEKWNKEYTYIIDEWTFIRICFRIAEGRSRLRVGVIVINCFQGQKIHSIWLTSLLLELLPMNGLFKFGELHRNKDVKWHLWEMKINAKVLFVRIWSNKWNLRIWNLVEWMNEIWETNTYLKSISFDGKMHHESVTFIHRSGFCWIDSQKFTLFLNINKYTVFRIVAIRREQTIWFASRISHFYSPFWILLNWFSKTHSFFAY